MQNLRDIDAYSISEYSCGFARRNNGRQLPYMPPLSARKHLLLRHCFCFRVTVIQEEGPGGNAEKCVLVIAWLVRTAQILNARP